VNEERLQAFHMERFSVKKLNEVRDEERYRVPDLEDLGA
jgi:hypothetical protein